PAIGGRPAPVAGDSIGRREPSSEPDPREPVVESIWAEPGRGLDGRGAVYVPPKPVQAFLDAPTAERARAYLAWNQQRLDAIARAAEVLSAVAADPPARNTPAPGLAPPPATCLAPAEAGSPRDPSVPEGGIRTPL